MCWGETSSVGCAVGVGREGGECPSMWTLSQGDESS